VTVEAKEAHAQARRILGSHRHLNLATQGMRIWCEVAPFRLEGEDLLCTLREGSRSMENVRVNPRVSFSIGGLNHGGAVRGSGIARPVPGGAAVTVSPYRFELDGHSPGSPPGSVIVRKGREWRIEDRAGSAPRSHAGLRGRLGFWLHAMRAVSFPLSLLPVVLGTALALMRGAFDPLVFVLSLLGGVASHEGANLVCDYNDFRNGIDTPDALSSHPGALVDESLPPERILAASFVVSLLAVAAGTILAVKVGYAILLIGAVGLLGGILYTSGSFAYKYRGLGELFIFFLMGPLMVAGAYFVQLRRIDLLPVILSLPLGLLVASVTLANNLRDMVDDHRSGTRTLPMRMGIRAAKRLYCGMLILPYALVGGVVVRDLSLFPLLLTLLSLPAAVKAIRAVWTSGDSAEEIRARATERRCPLNSIRLHLHFGVLLIAGCLLSWLLTRT
jgi:1,4-dihydroxy-2-naphthoate octaprenyltransferase